MDCYSSFFIAWLFAIMLAFSLFCFLAYLPRCLIASFHYSSYHSLFFSTSSILLRAGTHAFRSTCTNTRSLSLWHGRHAFKHARMQKCKHARKEKRTKNAAHTHRHARTRVRFLKNIHTNKHPLVEEWLTRRTIQSGKAGRGRRRRR